MVLIDPNQSVAGVVLEHPEAAAVFDRHHIRYCCGGSASVAEASFAGGVELEELLDQLEEAAERGRGEPELDVRSLEPAELAAHIASVGGGKLLDRARALDRLAMEVVQRHGDENPLLVGLSAALSELVEHLAVHLPEEDQALLVPLREGCAGPRLAPELRAMSDAHRLVGELLGEIRSCAEDYRVPPWGGASYQHLFAGLRRFDAALRHRVHLVNHALPARLPLWAI